jgi:hypothetical protein
MIVTVVSTRDWFSRAQERYLVMAYYKGPVGPGSIPLYKEAFPNGLRPGDQFRLVWVTRGSGRVRVAEPLPGQGPN